MKTAICSALTGAAMLALSGAASADEPVQLSDTQMDGVIASGFAQAAAAAGTIGDLLSETAASTSTFADNDVLAEAHAEAAGLAASVLGTAEAAAESTSAASLP